MWNERYAGEGYLFGTAPNAFLASNAARLKPGMSCLAVADGEGRNGVWLAEQGLRVVSVDSSSVAVEKAKALAVQRGVSMEVELADLSQWDWPENRFDVVAAIFIQFVGAAGRAQQFANLKRCLKPGGLLLFTSGPDEGGAGGEMYGESFGYCSLSPTEYRKLLAGQGLEVLLHKAEDPACGGHTVWLAAGKAGPS